MSHVDTPLEVIRHYVLHDAAKEQLVESIRTAQAQIKAIEAEQDKLMDRLEPLAPLVNQHWPDGGFYLQIEGVIAEIESYAPWVDRLEITIHPPHRHADKAVRWNPLLAAWPAAQSSAR